MKSLEKFIKNWNLPKERIIILHSAIKPIYQHFRGSYSYTEITDHIIEFLNKYYSPKTILIPTYTYSFTKSGIYHNIFSKSETGRFSEEARINYNFHRTPNPVFSYIDTEGILKDIKTINHLNAFGKDSVFGYLRNKDVVLANIGLKIFLGTPIHYIEQMFGVEYRYLKEFSGIIYYDENNYDNIDYQYQVRHLEIDSQVDREKLLRDMTASNKLHNNKLDDIDFRWILYDDYYDFFMDKLSKNDQYLFLNPYGVLPKQTKF